MQIPCESMRAGDLPEPSHAGLGMGSRGRAVVKAAGGLRATRAAVRAASGLVVMGIGFSLAACSSTPGSSSLSCAPGCDGGCPPPLSPGPPADAARTDASEEDAEIPTDLPPVARIGYRTTPLPDDSDYPYSMGHPPPGGIIPRATLYLSVADSFDPEGAPIAYFWNVQDPTGRYLTIEPDVGASRVSFVPSHIGAYTVTLEVIETERLHQIGQTTVSLLVAPLPCASDGASPPCSDELAVPGGTFVAGGTGGDGDGDEERPAHPATVAPFWLDKYEVTVGRFRRYLDAYIGDPPLEGAGAHPLIPGSGWQAAWRARLPTREAFRESIAECGGTWTDAVGFAEARPISCVTWYEAFAFCAWEGRRLPTEAEWEYAAAGGEEQRAYPWGDEEPSDERAVFGCLFDGDPFCSDADLPVGGSLASGAARWGHLDLAGSLWEWTLDVYLPYAADPCTNCAPVVPPVGAGRVFRGGDFRFGDPAYLRVTKRLAVLPGFPDQVRGFRCARSASDASP